MVAGLVAGALPWVVEAEVRFGGVRNRLAEAGDVQGGLGAVFLVPYAAPRFLLPAYALLALPAAVGLLAVIHRARTRRSLPTAAVLALALLGHWGLQADLVHTHASIQQRARGDWVRIASVLREHGVHPPCVLAGNRSTIPIAHTAGCTVTETDPSAHPSAVVLREGKPPRWARDWQRFPVPDTYNPGWTVVVPR
ncbi:hypothetical protein [Streptomyces sp. SP17KL33]|uniref:hypothetical protein n=1 Tax=Streptomyces sp. SP17KL33 TaxID=3002534 RepID=UPI002E77CAB6|nr:hypothetical protein [Streptomyces sp. SP17KL33]MEE1836035.1 hypothetical protein [Streptomyces sp. SP17KL33]